MHHTQTMSLSHQYLFRSVLAPVSIEWYINTTSPYPYVDRCVCGVRSGTVVCCCWWYFEFFVLVSVVVGRFAFPFKYYSFRFSFASCSCSYSIIVLLPLYSFRCTTCSVFITRPVCVFLLLFLLVPLYYSFRFNYPSC